MNGGRSRERALEEVLGFNTLQMGPSAAISGVASGAPRRTEPSQIVVQAQRTELALEQALGRVPVVVQRVSARERPICVSASLDQARANAPESPAAYIGGPGLVVCSNPTRIQAGLRTRQLAPAEAHHSVIQAFQ